MFNPVSMEKYFIDEQIKYHTKWLRRYFWSATAVYLGLMVGICYAAFVETNFITGIEIGSLAIIFCEEILSIRSTKEQLKFYKDKLKGDKTESNMDIHIFKNHTIITGNENDLSFNEEINRIAESLDSLPMIHLHRIHMRLTEKLNRMRTPTIKDYE